jgi:hypothetical protein
MIEGSPDISLCPVRKGKCFMGETFYTMLYDDEGTHI